MGQINYAIHKRNYVTNGDFLFNRTGSSYTITTSGITIDDWWMEFSNAGSPSVTISQDTDVPAQTIFKKSLKLTCSATVSLSNSAAYANIYHLIPSTASYALGQQAQYTTLSFWVKAYKAGLYYIVFKNYRSAGPDASYMVTYTIEVSNTWEFKTITIPFPARNSVTGDSVGTWDFDATSGLQISFNLATGTTYGTTTPCAWLGSNLMGMTSINNLDNTNNTFYLTGVMLNEGQEAAPYVGSLHGNVDVESLNIINYLDPDNSEAFTFSPINDPQLIAIPTPTHYWAFNEGTGSPQDSVGSLHLTMGSYTAWSATGGLKGAPAIVSNTGSVNNTYMRNAAAPAITGSFTMSFWWKPTATSSSANNTLMDVGTYESNTGFGMWADNTANTPRLTWRVNQNYSYYNYEYTGIRLILNMWYHIVLWYNGSNICIWLNGARVYQVAWTTNPNNPASYGVSFFGRPFTTPTDCAYGYVDQARIYNSEITSDQILALYYEGLSKRTILLNKASIKRRMHIVYRRGLSGASSYNSAYRSGVPADSYTNYRPLNKVLYNTIPYAYLNNPSNDESKQFILPPGRYTLKAAAAFYNTDSTALYLYNVTTSKIVNFGNSTHGYSASAVAVINDLLCDFYIETTSTFELRYFADTAQAQSNFGFAWGTYASFYAAVAKHEQYGYVEIEQIGETYNYLS
jgi:hypothetical protein